MERYPTATYLMGAMLDDGVRPDVALKIAHGYAEAQKGFDDEQTRKWLLAMLQRLDVGYGYTALAVLASPSEHIAAHYEDMAREAGWKENENARAQDA